MELSSNKTCKLVKSLIQKTKKDELKWYQLIGSVKRKIEDVIDGRIIIGYQAKHKDVYVGVYLRETEVYNNYYGTYVTNKYVEFFIANEENVFIFNEEVYGWDEEIDGEIFRLYKLAEVSANNIENIVDSLLD